MDFKSTILSSLNIRLRINADVDVYAHKYLVRLGEFDYSITRNQSPAVNKHTTEGTEGIGHSQ